MTGRRVEERVAMHSISCSRLERERIRACAEREGVSMSKLIVERALSRNPPRIVLDPEEQRTLLETVTAVGETSLRAQTEADLEATRWGLLAWEDPRERSKFKPFWIDEEMLMAAVVEPGDLVGMLLACATGMNVPGLRVLDGALVLKVQRGRRVGQIRVLEGTVLRPGTAPSPTAT